MTDLKLKVEKMIDAPVEQVFDAWLDAETLATFMLPAPLQQGGNFFIMA